MTGLPLPSAAELAQLHAVLLPDQPVTKARSLIRETRARILPVVEDEKSMKYLGVLRRRSLLLVTSTKSNLLVKDLMEEARVELGPETSVRAAVERMLQADEPYAPVLDASRKLRGILGYENVIEYLLSENAGVLEAPVGDHMTRSRIITVAPDEPVSRAWQLMISNNLAALPVVDRRGRLIGVIAEYDLLARGYARPELEADNARRGPRIREVMSTPPVTVKPTDPLRLAASHIVERGIGRVYVVEDDKLVGVVDRGDIVRAWLTR